MLLATIPDSQLALALATCILTICLPALYRSRDSPRAWVYFLLAAHTAYVAHTLCTSHPRDIFSDMGLPVTATSDLLIRRLREVAAVHPRFATPAVQDLAAKLSSMTMRERLYLYGQPAMNLPVGVEQSYIMLATIASPLLSYTTEAVFLGALTAYGFGLIERRKPAMFAVALAAATDMWWTQMGGAQGYNRQNHMSFSPYASAWSARNFFFLLFPALIVLFPSMHTIPILGLFFPKPQNTPAVSHAQLAMALEFLSDRYSFLRYGAGAIRRDEDLATRANTYWAREREVATHMWENPRVRDNARRLGLDLNALEESGGGMGVDVHNEVQRWATVSLGPPGGLGNSSS